MTRKPWSVDLETAYNAIRLDEPADRVVELLRVVVEGLAEEPQPNKEVLEHLICALAAYAPRTPAAQPLADRLTVLRLKLLA